MYLPVYINVFSFIKNLRKVYKGDMKKSSHVNNIGTGFPFCILALFYSLLVLSLNNINVFFIKFINNVSLFDIKQNKKFDL